MDGPSTGRTGSTVLWAVPVRTSRPSTLAANGAQTVPKRRPNGASRGFRRWFSGADAFKRWNARREGQAIDPGAGGRTLTPARGVRPGRGRNPVLAAICHRFSAENANPTGRTPPLSRRARRSISTRECAGARALGRTRANRDGEKRLIDAWPQYFTEFHHIE